MRFHIAAAAGFLATALFAGQAQAVPVVRTTSDNQIQAGVDNQGWWADATTNSNVVNDNYLVGFDSGSNYHNFFSFDLSGISGSVTSATFEVQRYSQFGNPIALSLWDVSTPAATLITTRSNISNPAIFADLGGGVSYGNFNVAAGANGDILSFNLNAAAIAAINTQLGGFFSIGGSATGGYLFGGSAFEPGNSGGTLNGVQRLTLNVEAGATAVPEPITLSLFGAGLIGAAAMRRRKKA